MANRNPLQVFYDKVVELFAERDEINQRIAETKAAAAKRGFSKKVLNNVLRRAKLTPEQREEEDALTQIYEGALGMLGGTPLGEAALRRLSEERKRRPEGGDDEDSELPFSDDDEQEPPGGASGDVVADDPVVEDSQDEARAKGAAAAQSGQPVLANPYKPRTKQRGWWDEAWCQASGSDGMDIPEAWRPTPKPKKGGPKPEGEGGEGSEGGDA
ncbi:GapR family DNA-binding domain-containing protein [Caulobacter sp. Root343]|uniref:GapR family DNA-binding domain-containing protein n=1 Tax=Caulobacter sp. Root343 TaxID=1736520 RepID=UPI0006F2FD7F|nr:GapR family DNA-binding domain-containing protein [Caulobacter sp. Root343]KQV66613.1 hypothetical protein ASC70_12325 [Caulobacter sp. Root343]